MDRQLYFHKTRKIYFFVDKKEQCSECGKLIENIIFFKAIWNKKNSEIKQFCGRCGEMAYKHEGVIDEVKQALLVEDVPSLEYTIPIFLRPPEVGSSTASVFDLGKITERYGTDHKTIDNTRLAGKESWEGAAIGNVPVERLEELDKKVNKKDATDYLNNLADAELQISEDKIKVIEDKTEKQHI